jgi:hypothetical protein
MHEQMPLIALQAKAKAKSQKPDFVHVQLHAHPQQVDS